MNGEAPYNAHFEPADTGHVAIARSCGEGWWEDWVYTCDRQWRRLSEVLLESRQSEVKMSVTHNSDIRRRCTCSASYCPQRTTSRVAANVVLVVLMAVMLGCASWQRGARVETPERLVAIRSLGVVRPIVGAYSEDGSYNVRPEPERASTAAAVLGAAVMKHFGALSGVQARQVDLARSEEASREVRGPCLTRSTGR
jgi:hypothetical protein